MSEPAITHVTYKSGTHHSELSWDVMQVIYQSTDCANKRRTESSFVIARTLDGQILRRADIVPERWEIITDPGDLKFFRSVFDDRDKAQLKDQEAKAATNAE
ncbi:MAG: hypothetical protein WAL51_04040 [Candidatus Acidiferrales bacterium]